MRKQLFIYLEKYDNLIIVFAFNEETVYNGLIANKIAGENHKTTLVIRETQDKYMGSLRSPIDIANKINDTGLALCQGHLQACGIELEKNKYCKVTGNGKKKDAEKIIKDSTIVKKKKKNVKECIIIN